MKVFIIGLPNSGRTSVASCLAEQEGNRYISAFDWFKSTFRPQHKTETADDYSHAFMEYMIERLRMDPLLFSNNIKDVIKSSPFNKKYIIDGLLNPKNFIDVFDYNTDMIVILNRVDNDQDAHDYDNISINVIRDYCFWLSASGLLSKDRWLEYNFKMTKDSSDFIKKLGSKNTVYLVKSLDKAIEHLTDVISHI